MSEQSKDNVATNVSRSQEGGPSGGIKTGQKRNAQNAHNKRASVSAKKIDLNSYVENLLNDSKRAIGIEALSEQDREKAEELGRILRESDYQASSALALKGLSESNQNRIIRQTENFEFLTQVFLQNHSQQISVNALKRIMGSISRAPQLIEVLLSQKEKSHFQKMLVQIGDSVTLNTDEYSELRWFLVSYATPSTLLSIRNTSIWKTYKGKLGEFFELENVKAFHILRKMEKNFQLLLDFLATLQVQKGSLTNINGLTPTLDKITIEDLIKFQLTRQDLANQDFFEILFKNSLQKKLADLSNIEACIPYFHFEVMNPGIFDKDALARSWKRSNFRTQGLVELFRSDEISKMKSEIESLNLVVDELKVQLSELTNISTSRELEINKLSKAIDSYEARLRDRAKTELVGQGAVERQLHINVYRKVVECIDGELSKQKSESLLMILAKLGISRLGNPGERIDWNSEYCESLTGELLDNPIVIRPGYTWATRDEKIVLTKVLVKPMG